MAESEASTPFEWGPYVQVAAFCEHVLQERDGVLSLIRLVDRITHAERGPEAPAEMPEFRYALNLVIGLKPGMARGRHELMITPQLPSGEAMPPLITTVQLEGENRGANLITRIDVPFKMEGLYWFTVRFDGQTLTRLPLDVRYSRLVTG